LVGLADERRRARCSIKEKPAKVAEAPEAELRETFEPKSVGSRCAD
jgi:hypothetical protein